MPKTLKKDGRLERPAHDEKESLLQVNVQLTKWDNWRLAKYALREGISKSEAARRAMKFFLDHADRRAGAVPPDWEN